MNKGIRIIGSILSVFVILVGVCLLSDIFVYGVNRVYGMAEQSSVANGDLVLANRFKTSFGEPNRFDLVLVQVPGDETITAKRVIGLPGEKIEYIQNNLYVNGEVVAEDFLPSEIRTSYFSTIKFFPQDGGKIPEGQYFLVNDDRTDLIDSRSFGTVTKDNLHGSISFRIYPFDKIGNVQ